MSKVIPLGRVSGIRIGAQWSALFIVALVGLILASDIPLFFLMRARRERS